uniref:Uncharacterized protein n=1 Tax=Brassica campestris TaxID=3711 RepID=A0A3P5YUN2_BRACM|nr:unnamed protein product [Brassica rapa]
MVVEPLNAAIQIHQWWEQNPSSLLIMVKSQQLRRIRRQEGAKANCWRDYLFTRKNFNITDRREKNMQAHSEETL